MKLTPEQREAWLSLATRLREMPSDQFYSHHEYDPIREELAQLAWNISLRDMDVFMSVHRSIMAREATATIDWGQTASAEEALVMLQMVISHERWVDGRAVEPHRNGFLSFALESVANSDGDFVAAE
jgi:hypothetical protein